MTAAARAEETQDATRDGGDGGEAASAAQEAGARIERLLTELRGSIAPLAWRRVEALVAAMTAVYGHGLARALEAIMVAGQGRAAAAIERLCDDPLIESLLLLHGLHPLPIDARVDRALARVRRAIGAPPDAIERVGPEEGRSRGEADVVTVRVSAGLRAHRGAGDALVESIERALAEAAPEISTVLVEGLNPTVGAADAPGGGLVQIDLARSRSRAAPPGGGS